MKLAGKRIAILAENMYQEMELWVPYYRLKEEIGRASCRERV